MRWLEGRVREGAPEGTERDRPWWRPASEDKEKRGRPASEEARVYCYVTESGP
jgi:hypothetical protein